MGLSYHRPLILLNLLILANFVSAESDWNTSFAKNTVQTSTVRTVPVSSAPSPTTSPDVFEVTEPIISSDYDDSAVNDTSMEILATDETDLYDDIDVGNSTSLDNDSTLSVQLDRDPYYKYTTVNGISSNQEDSPSARLLHYGGRSAIIVGILSIGFVVVYISWRTTTKISYLSA